MFLLFPDQFAPYTHQTAATGYGPAGAETRLISDGIFRLLPAGLLPGVCLGAQT